MSPGTIMMRSSSAVFVFTIVCVCGTVLSQVSFSTHWGKGKRSQLFDAPPQTLSNVFTDNSNSMLQCLTKMEYNVLRYMTIIVERELKQVRQCLLADKDVEYE